MSGIVIMAASQRPRSIVGLGQNVDNKAPSPPNKQCLKRVQIPLMKFNDVAIPHHIDLLKKHKSNIEKFQAQGAWDQVHREQINATRMVKELKALVYEIDMLRNQVQDSDLKKFDELTNVARQTAHDTITEYLNLNPNISTSGNKYVSIYNTMPINVGSGGEDDFDDDQRETEIKDLKEQIRNTTDELEKRKQCLQSWEHLQSEVRDINELFLDFSKIVHEQQENVDLIETSMDTTSHNVAEGASHLKHVKTAFYPLAGAVLGSCIGGPVGLLAGMKLGGLAAVGCGFLGFTGGKILKKKQDEGAQMLGIELSYIKNNQSVKGSTSLPEISRMEEFSKTVSKDANADIL